jgi:ADP-ribosylation factor family
MDRFVHWSPLPCRSLQDLHGSASSSVIAEQVGVAKWERERSARVCAISAYTGEGVGESLQWLIEEIKRSPRTQLLRAKAIKA